MPNTSLRRLHQFPLKWHKTSQETQHTTKNRDGEQVQQVKSLPHNHKDKVRQTSGSQPS